MRTVFWKPLYFTSIFMFIISLVLIPFSIKWSIIVVLALITIWTRIPGFLHFVFNRLAMNDLFSFIVAATAGVPIGIGFHLFGMWGARLFGPDEWTPYTIKATIQGFVALLFVPFLIGRFGGITLFAFLWFQIISYIVFYLQVLIFARNEIMLEIALLPAVLFFDFGLNLQLLGIFGETIADMMVNGIESGWPFIIFAGVILLMIFISKNATKWGSFLKEKWDDIIGRKEEKGEDEDYQNQDYPDEGVNDNYSGDYQDNQQDYYDYDDSQG